MLEQLTRLNSDHLTFLAVVSAMLLAAVTMIGSTLLVQVRRYRERQLEFGFREEMLRRGLSVEQIAQLLNAQPSTVSQSVRSSANRLREKLATAYLRLAETVPPGLDRLRVQLRPFWNETVGLCRAAWARTSRYARQAWQDARPLVHRARTAISRWTDWLSNGLRQLSRRVAPHRP